MTSTKLTLKLNTNEGGCKIIMYAKESYLYKIQNILTISEGNRQIIARKSQYSEVNLRRLYY